VAFVKIKGVEPFLLTHPGFYFFILTTLKEHSLVFKAAANVQPFFFTSKTFFEVFFEEISLEEQPLFSQLRGANIHPILFLPKRFFNLFLRSCCQSGKSPLTFSLTPITTQ
jgi:hypothetical protein